MPPSDATNERVSVCATEASTVSMSSASSVSAGEPAKQPFEVSSGWRSVSGTPGCAKSQMLSKLCA